MADGWDAGANYERYMGRWSRRVAAEFVEWLDQPRGLEWLDVGCGTGALSATVLERAGPRSLLGVDPSDGFIAHARETIADPRARFESGSASAIPAPTASADIVVSGLAYNFFPDRPDALREMQRVARPGGGVSFYVWDYPGGGMGFMRAFWNAAEALDPSARAQTEGVRFPFCTAELLAAEAAAAGLRDVTTRAIEVTARFESFADFWEPFTLGTGPAPAYLVGLEPSTQAALKRRLEAGLHAPGPVEFVARAWAVRSTT